MSINRCTIIILSFISFALLVAGTALTSNNRPLWPGFICFGAMFGCVIAAWLIDDEGRPARARAYHRQQHAAAPGVESIPPCPACYVAFLHDGTTERVPCHYHADIRSVAIEREASR